MRAWPGTRRARNQWEEGLVGPRVAVLAAIEVRYLVGTHDVLYSIIDYYNIQLSFVVRFNTILMLSHLLINNFEFSRFSSCTWRILEVPGVPSTSRETTEFRHTSTLEA